MASIKHLGDLTYSLSNFLASSFWIFLVVSKPLFGGAVFLAWSFFSLINLSIPHLTTFFDICKDLHAEGEMK
jgi:hypothetical protein